MLCSLFIQNFILIEKTHIHFANNLNVITGETGAGKSLLLGALKLILGEKIEKKWFMNQSQKCVIEAVFKESLSEELEIIFEENDISFEEDITIRREVSSTGKSRAFVNDSLVALQVLRSITNNWIDIHQQHESLEIKDEKFRHDLLDHFGNLQDNNSQYQSIYSQYINLEKEYQSFLNESSKNDEDYYKFQLNELSLLDWDKLRNESPEQKLQELNHAEDISIEMNKASNLLQHEEKNIIDQLTQSIDALRNAEKNKPNLDILIKRLEQVRIELKDVAYEMESIAESIQFNPEEYEVLQKEMNKVFDLQFKHKVHSIEELKHKYEEISEMVDQNRSREEILSDKKQKMLQKKDELQQIGEQVFEKRKKIIPRLEEKINQLIQEVDLKGSRFEMELTQKPFQSWSKLANTQLLFNFSANPGIPLQDVSKIASGGEISRLMLCLKSLLAQKNKLPTLIFDEVDTGISGETAMKVGKMLRQLSAHLQLIVVTHLPQIASAGNYHLLIKKDISHDKTSTSIVALSYEQRKTEIAKMFGGENPSEAAFQTATQLLENKY